MREMDARTITLALRGKWHGRYGVAFCPAHANSRTPALTLSGGRDGRLLAHCKAGCAFEEVAAALRSNGLLGASGGFSTRLSAAETAKRLAEERAEREKRIRQAQQTWAETVPIEGTLGERYLRARAISGPLAPSLRFHPSCWHKSARRFPALVAAVLNDGKFVGVHRTYLAEPGSKAETDPVKAMLGAVSGGAVPLSDGSGALVVAEGIETSLSLRDGLTALSPRVWAALSTSGMAGLQLPSWPGELAVAPDSDAAGRKAAEELARRAWGLGWHVRIIEPPHEGDWNDAAKTNCGFAPEVQP